MSTVALRFEPSAELATELSTFSRRSLIVGIVLAVLSLVGGFFDPGDFFRSYLMGYLFWIGLALGSLGIVMMQYLTAGAWGVVSRRVFESATRTLSLLAVLFLPILLGLPNLYDWAHPDLVKREYTLQHRAGYMNPPMFILRAVVYFAIWGIFTYFLNRWSREQDESGRPNRRLAALSAPGLILYVFTVTFAAVDWAESLETDWYSTIWGFLFVANQGLSAFAFVIIALALLRRREPMASLLKPAYFHDFGNLLLTMVMVWAYFSFSQLLIVWSGNLTDEIPWYLRRLGTSWGWLGVALIVFEFVVPFLLLLWKEVKRNTTLLCGVVGLIIVMRFVDLMWIVMPSYYQKGFRLSWLNFSVPLAMGGLWLWAYARELKKWPLLPVGAPNLERAIEHGEEEE